MDRGVAGTSETKIMYYLDDGDIPYSCKLPIPLDKITLRDFKASITLPNRNNNRITSFKYFFRTLDEEEGTVREEVKDDSALLPNWKGKVICYITADVVDGSNVSSGSSSQVTEVSGLHGSRNGHHHHGRQNGPLRSVPSGFRGHMNHHPANYRNYPDDVSTTCTEETESTISSRCPRRGSHGRDCGCDSVSSILTSDMDSESFVDSDDDSDEIDEDDSASRFTSTTAGTSVSRIQESRYRRRQQRQRRRMHAMSDASSVSSVTDSTMSMNVITVTLTLDSVTFLGISLVGQENRGIFIGNIMDGGAVALDGRIDPGDMILQVNDINLENMSNDEAVKILREATTPKKLSPGSVLPRTIRLVILKTWDHSRGTFTIPKSEPVRPIDPGAWVAHTEAARAAGEYPMRPPSASTMRSNGSSVEGSCVTDSERLLGLDHNKVILNLEMDMLTIAKAMASYDSGLDVREREWLKLKIPNAFYGSDVVDWLFGHVQGFQERREAKKYASGMLKAGFLKHVYKKGFSEQSFYTFGEEIASCMEGLNRLRLEAEVGGHSHGYLFHGSQHRTSSSENSSSDRDTLLLAPGRDNGHHHHHNHSNHSSPIHSNRAPLDLGYAEPVGASSTAASNGFLPWGPDAVHYGVFGGVPANSNNRGNSTSSESTDQRSQLTAPLPATGGVSSFKSFQANQMTSFSNGTNGMSHLQHVQQQHSYQNQHQYAEPTYSLSTPAVNGGSNGHVLSNGVSDVSYSNQLPFISPSSSGLDKNGSVSNGRSQGSHSTSIGIKNLLRQLIFPWFP